MNHSMNTAARRVIISSTPPTIQSSASARLHLAYCLVVTLATVALKLWLALDIKASPMMADDYAYLSKAPYYLSGDLAMRSYPFVNVPAGVVYPLVLSPWLLADDPGHRILLVHFINFVLSAVTIFFGSRTIARLSGSNHLLPPLCLAAMPTLFIFSFHALTENLLFALLAILAWLVIDFRQTCLRWRRLAILLVAVLLLPQVRAPGIAVVPALVLLAWLHRRSLGRRRAWLVALGVSLISVGPYLIYSAMAPSWRGRGRELYYLDSMASVIRAPRQMLVALQLAGDQVAYLLISGGYWILPVLLVVAIQVRRWAPSAARDRWRDYLVFAGVSSAIFVAFCMSHLLMRGNLLASASERLYGRYDDPALVLIVLGGIAAAFVLQRTRWEVVVLYVLAPISLCLAVNWLGQLQWVHTMQHSGLAFFQGHPYGWKAALLGTAAAIIMVQLAPWRRWRVPVWLGVLLVYFASTNMRAIGTADHPGSARIAAAKIAGTQKVADWIHLNLPKTACLGCDASVARDHPVGLYSMARVYLVFWFSTYPRDVIIVENDADLRRCDYLFTRTGAANARGLPIAWSEGYFSLYRVIADPPDSLAACAAQ